MPSSSSCRYAEFGRLLVAAALLAQGVQHLVLGRFVTRLVPPTSSWGPLNPALSYPVGVLLLVLGACIALRRRTVAAALIFSAGCLVSFLFLHLPAAAASGAWGGEWTSAGKALTFCAVGLAVAGWSAAGPKGPAPDGVLRQFAAKPALDFTARVFFAAFLLLCGIQHFLWWQFVQTLVPAWLPGARFWTYFAAVALIAGAVGLLLPRTRRLAAHLTGSMIFSWVFLVHLPRALSMRNANETTAVFEALAFAGLGWILAGRAAEGARAD